MLRLLFASSCLALCGCGLGVLDELAKVPVCDSQATDPECEALFGSSTGGAGVPTTTAMTDATSGGSGVHTVTGDTTLADSTAAADGAGTGEPADPAPTIDLFTAEPDQLSEAGQSRLQLHASPDVVAVRLYQNGEKLADLTPADFPYTYEALSAKYNGDPHIFKVEARDAAGQTATDHLELKVLLPASGTERCSFTDEGMGAASSAITAVVYGKDAIVAAGWRDAGKGQRMTVWKLDKASCDPIPGWPKTIADWTMDPALAMQASQAVGVAIDASGYIAVAANLWPGGKPQMYAALLTPQGSRIWERPGKLGEQAAAIAAGDGHRVFVTGSVRTSDNPVLTDARTWGLNFDNESLTVWSSDLAAPFTPEEADPDIDNKWSERGRAVLVWNGEVFVACEREFMDDQKEVFTRTSIARYQPFGGLIGPPRTSPGDFLSHEAMNALAICGTDLIAGGWTRDKAPGASPVPLMRWIEPDGKSSAGHSELLPSTRTFGVGCDREGKIVSGGTSTAGALNTQVFASEDPKNPPILYDAGVTGDDATLTLACDPDEGFCAGGGFRSPFAYLRVYHP